jgi:hypothetical protein
VISGAGVIGDYAIVRWVGSYVGPGKKVKRSEKLLKKGVKTVSMGMIGLGSKKNIVKYFGRPSPF